MVVFWFVISSFPFYSSIDSWLIVTLIKRGDGLNVYSNTTITSNSIFNVKLSHMGWAQNKHYNKKKMNFLKVHLTQNHPYTWQVLESTSFAWHDAVSQHSSGVAFLFVSWVGLNLKVFIMVVRSDWHVTFERQSVRMPDCDWGVLVCVCLSLCRRLGDRQRRQVIKEDNASGPELNSGSRRQTKRWCDRWKEVTEN